MVLELAGRRALDRPVAGVVDARGHLVGDQLAARLEELDRQHADVVQSLHHAGGSLAGLRLRAPASRPAPGRATARRMPLAVVVLDQRVERRRPVPAAHGDLRHLALEGDEPSSISGTPPSACQAAATSAGVRSDELPLAVVAEPARLEHGGQAERRHAPRSRSAQRVDGGERGGRRCPARANSVFSAQAVLAHLQGARRRVDGHALRRGAGRPRRARSRTRR